MILNFIKKNKFLISVIILSLLFHLLISFPSGSYYCFNKKCGLYFWGAHEHDGIWHLAIVETAFKTWPPKHPVFAGEKLKGYNYFLDLIIFFLSKIGIPAIVWYFKILPLFWIVLMIFFLGKLSQKLKKDYFYQVFLLFFVFFGSSFGYFLTLYHKKTLIGSSSSLAMQAGLTLTNLHFAYSLVFLTILLLFLLKKEKNNKDIFFIGVLNFIILAVKFYGGVISLFITFFYLFFENFKKNFFDNFFTIGKRLLIILFLFFLSFILFYQPFTVKNKNNTGLVFSPFSIAHSIIEEKDLFYIPKLVNARYFLYSVNPLSLRLIIIEFFTAFLFIFFNLGTRFLGIIYFLIKLLKKKINLFEITVFLGIIFSFSLSLMFIQKGIWWNTIQFSYYGLFLANFLIADLISKVLKNKKRFITYLIIISIILTTLPENYDILRGFIPHSNTTYIPKEELKALSFLKKQPEGVIFTPIINLSQINKHGPKILALTRDTAYVSAFSAKPTYLNDTHVLKITGINYEEREKNVEKGNLLSEKITYLYLLKNTPTTFFQSLLTKKAQKIFENEMVEIWQIKKEGKNN